MLAGSSGAFKVHFIFLDLSFFLFVPSYFSGLVKKIEGKSIEEEILSFIMKKKTSRKDFIFYVDSC